MKFEVVEEAVVNLLSRGQRLYHPTVSAGDGREKKEARESTVGGHEAFFRDPSPADTDVESALTGSWNE